MLTLMHVRNFAIIDEISVEFAPGMNVLTGETGAGKSILVDALGLVLGARSSADVIRADAERAEIAAVFEPNAAALQWLGEQALDAGSECHLRRVIARDGRARGFINGNPASMQSLRQLGALLVNIHGQHEHQTLTQADVQRRMLDERGDYTELLAATASDWAAWHAAREALQAVQSDDADQAERAEFLRYQLRELDELGLAEGEYATLEAERRRLANAGDYAERGQSALSALSEADDANVQALLAAAHRAIDALADDEPAMAEVARLLDEAQTSVSEATADLQRFLSATEADPSRLQTVEARLDAVLALARKHRIAPEAVHAQADALREALELIDTAESRLGELADRVDATRAALDATLATLTRSRVQTAGSFATEIAADMQRLGMQGGRFEVEVEPLAGDPQPHGQDRVRYLVSANPGQPVQPLARVASGGELSRISLAIQVASGQRQGVASLVFDEVDSGVGGAVAEVVGRKMRALSTDCQVLAVTHLPQVAGQAHHHLKVSKVTDGETTRTRIVALSEDERVEEIARMLGGLKITATSRRHAREMLAAGES